MTMCELLVRGAAEGVEPVVEVTPASAGWEYVGFEVLRPNGPVARGPKPAETCLVVVAGSCDVSAAGERWERLGGRPTPFDGPPEAVYLPPDTAFEIEPRGPGLELAICTAPARGGIAPHRIDGGSVEAESRGRGAFAREVRPILMDAERREAEALLVCEVLTPAGHWSSFPPHKHDREALPAESRLEETYYHRIAPAGGFGVQRVYTDDGEIDEAIAFADRDTVLVPRGYHVVSAPPGYDLYYLNVMAGPVRRWAVADDPAHAWVAA
jgi:5-deoxy-glucuronate isomerase